MMEEDETFDPGLAGDFSPNQGGTVPPICFYQRLAQGKLAVEN